MHACPSCPSSRCERAARDTRSTDARRKVHQMPPFVNSDNISPLLPPLSSSYKRERRRGAKRKILFKKTGEERKAPASGAGSAFPGAARRGARPGAAPRPRAGRAQRRGDTPPRPRGGGRPGRAGAGGSR